MGKRGPQKQPTAVLEKKGSWRAKVREDEPVFDIPTSVRMPASLGYHGKTLWKRLFPILVNRGVLTEVDLRAFERYCFYYELWRGLVKGDDYNNLMKAETALTKLEQQFGLTPASRPNVKANKVDKEDKTKRFFKVG